MSSPVLVPTRIKEARESSGLSMGELSELIGVTSSAISEYEKGKIKPSIFVLKSIANVLKFPINYFYKPVEQNAFDNSVIYFRAMKTTPKKVKTAYASRVKWAYEIHSYLMKYVEFIPINFPKIVDTYDVDNLEPATIEKIAIDVRRHLDIGNGPIGNVTDLIENLGILACGISYKNKKIDGFSQWYNGVPFIFYGSHRTSSASYRFSLSHELAHLLLHSHITLEEASQKNIFDKMEHEANLFAASFLLPEEAFSIDFLHNSLEYLTIMKSKWKVSIAALIMRAKHLRLISENQASYLFRQMAINKQRIDEPLDDVIPYETPCSLKDSIDLLIENRIQTKHDIMDSIALSENEIVSICSLPENYFVDNDAKENKVALRILR